MTTSEQLILMYLQLAATIAMAFDYFVPENTKRLIDIFCRRPLTHINIRVSKDLSSAVHEAIGKRWFIYTFMGAIVLLMTVNSWDSILIQLSPSPIPEITIFCVFVAAILSIAAFWITYQKPLTTIFIAVLVKLLLLYLRKSPRGPIAAAGLLILAISYWYQYHLLSRSAI